MTLAIEESSPLDNLTKPGSTAVSSESNSNQNSRSNPVCLEVTVTIRSLPGDKGEASFGTAKPTREEARTVIVFDNGAVLRLASNFPAGQTVILSDSQGRDVVCRVVSTRNLPTVKGYIEVEFLEPTTDFWGIHKPEGQSSVSNPPPAVIKPPKAVAQLPIVPPEPPPSLPAPARLAPIVPESVAPAGKAPSFEDIAGVIQMSPPPPALAKVPESPSRIPVSKNPDDSTHPAVEAARSYLPAGASGTTSDFTSLSATWEGPPPPSRKPSTSNDILGKFSASNASAESTSGEFRGKTPLIVAGAAVFLITLGAGFFYMRRGDSVRPSPVSVAAVSQPATPEPPVPASVPIPAAVDQPIAEQAQQAPPLSPAISQSSSLPKEIVAAATASVPQTARRKATIAADTPLEHADVKDVKPSDRSALHPQVARDLKMSSPIVEGQSGRLVDGTVPNLDDAVVTGGTGAPGGALISTVSHPDKPPAPPAVFSGPSSPGKTSNEPQLISSTRPVYPPLAKQTNVEGDVVISADIDAAGKVVAAKAIAGPMYLRQAAVDAVRNWKYQPATISGRPTPAQITVKIQFRLK